MLHISLRLVRFQLRIGINVSLSPNTVRHPDHTDQEDGHGSLGKNIHPEPTQEGPVHPGPHIRSPSTLGQK